jgi:hypothetical protein
LSIPKFLFNAGSSKCGHCEGSCPKQPQGVDKILNQTNPGDCFEAARTAPRKDGKSTNQIVILKFKKRLHSLFSQGLTIFILIFAIVLYQYARLLANKLYGTQNDE